MADTQVHRLSIKGGPGVSLGMTSVEFDGKALACTEVHLAVVAGELLDVRLHLDLADLDIDVDLAESGITIVTPEHDYAWPDPKPGEPVLDLLE